jgi:mycothiol synthase
LEWLNLLFEKTFGTVIFHPQNIGKIQNKNETHNTGELNMTIKPLATALTLRAVQRSDLNAIVQLIYEICAAEGDTSVASTPEDLENEWDYAGFDPEQDAFVIQTEAGNLVGYGAVFDVNEHCEMSGDIYVHPQYKNRGVESALLGALESRVQVQHVPLAASGQRVFIRVALDNKDEAGKAILAQVGYAPARYHWRMGIELDAAPPVPTLPDGLEFRPFSKEEHAAAVWQARNEAYQGNWGSRHFTFEEFSYFTFENPEYDPSLWMVIWDGNEVAGFSINHYRMGIGWIHILAVRPAWRAKKLGLALLHRSFAEFYQRGTKSIGLGVDAANVTGATKLYQKVGMTTVSEFVTMEKELRAGKTS